MLWSLNAFENTTYIGDNLEVWDNVSLTTLNAFHNLPSIGGYLSIGNNVSMSSLEAFENLTSIADSLGFIKTTPWQVLAAWTALIQSVKAWRFGTTMH
ncbi:MAG: hypothetical protein IPF52_15050 [Saprospiraceae bacterium]|nr:hypothetical protein [Saprospiraceae bacterium]